MIVARNGCWDSHAIVLSALWQVFVTQPRPRQVGLDTHTILGYFLELNRPQHHTFEAVQVLHSLSLELTELRVLLPARRPVWTFFWAQLTNRFRCIKTLRFRILLCVNFFTVSGVQRSVFCSLFRGIFDVWCNWLSEKQGWIRRMIWSYAPKQEEWPLQAYVVKVGDHGNHAPSMSIGHRILTQSGTSWTPLASAPRVDGGEGITFSNSHQRQ